MHKVLNVAGLVLLYAAGLSILAVAGWDTFAKVTGAQTVSGWILDESRRDWIVGLAVTGGICLVAGVLIGHLLWGQTP